VISSRALQVMLSATVSKLAGENRDCRERCAAQFCGPWRRRFHHNRQPFNGLAPIAGTKLQYRHNGCGIAGEPVGGHMIWVIAVLMATIGLGWVKVRRNRKALAEKA